MDTNQEQDIILTNKGSFERTQTFIEQEKDLKHQLSELMVPLGEFGKEATEELRQKLETNTIPEKEIDQRVLGIKEDIIKYFGKQSILEGLLDESKTFGVKVVFVKPEFFDGEIATHGKYYPLERMVIINYQEINDEIDLFSISTTIFHEIRHCVTKQVGSVHLNPKGKPFEIGEVPYDTVDILSGMDLMTMDPLNDLLEEVYVEGFTAMNLEKVNNLDLQKSVEWSKDRLKKQGLDTRFITTYKKKTYGLIGFENSNPDHVLQLFYLLHEKIPSLLEMLADVRSGKPDSKRILAQEIISNYDKETLGILLRGSKDEAVFSKIIVEQKK